MTFLSSRPECRKRAILFYCARPRSIPMSKERKNANPNGEFHLSWDRSDLWRTATELPLCGLAEDKLASNGTALNYGINIWSNRVDNRWISWGPMASQSVKNDDPLEIQLINLPGLKLKLIPLGFGQVENLKKKIVRLRRWNLPIHAKSWGISTISLFDLYRYATLESVVEKHLCCTKKGTPNLQTDRPLTRGSTSYLSLSFWTLLWTLMMLRYVGHRTRKKKDQTRLPTFSHCIHNIDSLTDGLRPRVRVLLDFVFSLFLGQVGFFCELFVW